MAIKKSMTAIVALLEANAEITVGEVVDTQAFKDLVEAKRGGASHTEDNWLLDGEQRVGRVCAILGAFYPHNNEDKAVSHFYKNGSYHIVIEKLKNLKLKAHKQAQVIELARLEDDMMEGVITPKEWKAKKDAVLSEFKFEISEETKNYLVELTKGYLSKEELQLAIEDDTLNTDFSAIEDDVNRYLAEVEAELFPTVEEPAEPTDEA